MLALIDADGIIFNCGFSVEHTTYLLYDLNDEVVFSTTSKKEANAKLKEGNYGLGVVKETEPLGNCLHLVKRKLQSILDAVDATDYRVYIKGTGNFRDAIAVTKPYKGNRDTAHRPMYESDIRQYLINKWSAILVDGQEADDAVAIEQWKNYTDLESAVTIICSPDKDLLQIPGWHYNYLTKEKFWITEDEGVRFFYKQLLMGDASDNIQGIPGCGPETAERILSDAGTVAEFYRRTKEAYEKAYKETSEEVLNEMAQLLYIRKREGEVWKPPT